MSRTALNVALKIHPKEMEFSFLYVTTGSTDEAVMIARALIEARLAACATVLDGATSLYWWEGELEEAAEAVLFAKTREDLVDEAIAKVRALHSYDCPCVVALPIARGNPAYLEWIARETA